MLPEVSWIPLGPFASGHSRCVNIIIGDAFSTSIISWPPVWSIYSVPECKFICPHDPDLAVLKLIEPLHLPYVTPGTLTNRPLSALDY